MSGPVGVIYLICFDRPLKHARHYVGFCEKLENVDSRLEYHLKGRGSRLLAAVADAGIDANVVRLWKGTRDDERAIKNTSHSRMYCPVCSSKPRKRNGLEEIPV